MKSLVLFAAAAIALCGAALAQSPSRVVTVSRGMFEAVPVGADYPRVFPRRAIERRQSGFAVLCCKANPNRTLACNVGAEWPAQFGFGAASLQLAERFRLAPSAYEKLQADGFPVLETPMPWNIEPISERNRNELSAAKARMQNICAAPPSTPVS